MTPTEEKEYISTLIKQCEAGDVRAMEEVATYYSQNHPELMNGTTTALVLEYYEKAISLCAQGITKKSYTIRFDAAHIEVLSKIRIPFDNITSNDILEFKDDFLFAIRALSVNKNSVISARYGTTNPKKQFYDLENVLFYNIGTANFTDLTMNGIAFAEAPHYDILSKRNEWGVSEEYEHYYEYKICPLEVERCEGLEIASWKDIPFCKCKSLSPLDAWMAMHKANSDIHVKERIECEFGDMFALDLVFEKPRALEFNITSAMKPLLDGIISALHGGLFDEDTISLLMGKLLCTRDQFVNVGMNVLGKREYIQKYPRAKNGIKWNPADDMCKSVSIQIVDGDEWRLSGRIYKILPRCPKCNKTKVAKILYGMPAMSEELEKQLDEGSVVLAGCCIEGEMPRYRCRWCKTEF